MSTTSIEALHAALEDAYGDALSAEDNGDWGAVRAAEGHIDALLERIRRLERPAYPAPRGGEGEWVHAARYLAWAGWLREPEPATCDLCGEPLADGEVCECVDPGDPDGADVARHLTAHVDCAGALARRHGKPLGAILA